MKTPLSLPSRPLPQSAECEAPAAVSGAAERSLVGVPSGPGPQRGEARAGRPPRPPVLCLPQRQQLHRSRSQGVGRNEGHIIIAVGYNYIPALSIIL